jgi:hypothetical protein
MTVDRELRQAEACHQPSRVSPRTTSPRLRLKQAKSIQVGRRPHKRSSLFIGPEHPGIVSSSQATRISLRLHQQEERTSKASKLQALQTASSKVHILTREFKSLLQSHRPCSVLRIQPSSQLSKRRTRQAKLRGLTKNGAHQHSIRRSPSLAATQPTYRAAAYFFCLGFTQALRSYQAGIHPLPRIQELLARRKGYKFEAHCQFVLNLTRKQHGVVNAYKDCTAASAIAYEARSNTFRVIGRTMHNIDDVPTLTYLATIETLQLV